MPQSKAYQQYLENTGNKAKLTDRFTQYIQQDQLRSKLKGNVILNSRDVTYRINSSELKTQFTPNHKEVDTKTVYCSSSFNKPSTTGTCKQTKILLLVLGKFMKNLAAPLA